MNKLNEIIDLYNLSTGNHYTLQNVAYMGDDILDIPCMRAVKDAMGIVGCPKDAIHEVLEISDFVSDKNGGNGAVRSFIEHLVLLHEHQSTY